MKLSFNGQVLAERFYDPRFGDLSSQTQFRQPFGTRGLLALMGGQGGQPVAVPVRLVATSYSELNDAINACYLQKGLIGDLELEYAKGTKKVNGKHSIGKAILVDIQETRQRSFMVFDSELKGNGWHVTLTLTFQTLEPPSSTAGGRSGFGR